MHIEETNYHQELTESMRSLDQMSRDIFDNICGLAIASDLPSVADYYNSWDSDTFLKAIKDSCFDKNIVELAELLEKVESLYEKFHTKVVDITNN